MSVAVARVVSTKNHTAVAAFVDACILINELAEQLKAAEAEARTHQQAAIDWVQAHPSASVASDGSRTLQVRHEGELRVLQTAVKTKAKVVGDAAEVLAWCRQAGVKLSKQPPEYLHSSTLASAVKSGVVAEGNPLFDLVTETSIAVK